LTVNTLPGSAEEEGCRGGIQRRRNTEDEGRREEYRGGGAQRRNA
jgi:hypothetical protein